MPAIGIQVYRMNSLIRGSFLKLSLAGAVSGLLLLPPVAGRCQTNDLSLANNYPLPALQRLLLPREQWQPYPTIKDRPGWQALPADARSLLVQQGEAALAEPVPVLPATLYLEYARNGNRSRFEAQHKARRQMLHRLVLAECFEAKGRFLEAIANLAWAICEESTWCYPAHVGAQKTGVGLPDVNEPIVALFSAETAVSLAWTLYLLDGELDKVSRRIRPRLVQEIDRRILTPFLERDDFGWMAFYNVTRTHRPNNWNPWINASVLTAALLVEPDADRRAQLAHKVLRSVDRFLLAHPADGSCDEGPGYWGHAGGSLFDTLELLHRATAGQFDVFGEPLIQEIGRFMYRAHVADDYYVPVGDCSARLTPYRALVYAYGKRIQEPRLVAQAAQGATLETVLESASDRYFGRLLGAVFNVSALLAERTASPPLVRDVWLPSEDLQLMAARDREGTPDGFYVAAWGAHNGQSHNHNDVGNFIVFADGQPVLVDVGVTTYTAQTFSSRRYEIWVMQSAFHNLPTINGAPQRAGSSAAARNVVYEANDTFAQVAMELADAYPPAAQVVSWQHSVRLNRGKDLVITDAFQLNAAPGPTSQNLMTPLEVTLAQPGQLRFKLPPSDGQSERQVLLTYDPAKLTPEIERRELDDERLAKVWGSHLNRIVLRAQTGVLKDTWTLRLTLPPH